MSFAETRQLQVPNTRLVLQSTLSSAHLRSRVEHPEIRAYGSKVLNINVVHISFVPFFAIPRLG